MFVKLGAQRLEGAVIGLKCNDIDQQNLWESMDVKSTRRCTCSYFVDSCETWYGLKGLVLVPVDMMV